MFVSCHRALHGSYGLGVCPKTWGDFTVIGFRGIGQLTRSMPAIRRTFCIMIR
ncbi:hypothetical protein PAXRUDRAFT_834110 [Paxillus rubicundulus Ve08.2h10]|uniref:Uncharacterized protein n=1 Tax=Paxillus rubicundulus Ve08.2h10 TaxID=930991 RepID=A0A0D0DM24_9AGAM|nr:hypothetical protein PAXRUDRAFT_834110 [Paxillus rubicundulus Ve08.2h10]